MNILTYAYAKLKTRAGLGAIGFAILVNAVLLLTGMGSLAMSQFNQLNMVTQIRQHHSDQANRNALVMSGKLIKTQDLTKNPTTKVWSAAASHTANPLWTSIAASGTNLGELRFSSCDPRRIGPISTEGPNTNLATCTKLTTTAKFLPETQGQRPQIQIVSALDVPSTRSLSALLVPTPTVDLKVTPPSGFASNGPITILNGQSVTLSWISTDADSCSLSPLLNTQLNHAGLATGPLIASTTYTLTCTSSGGGSTDSITVNVMAIPVPVADLKVTPPGGVASDGPVTINADEKVTLSWTSSNATNCTVAAAGLNGLNNPGVQTAALALTTTFTLDCVGAGGSRSDSVVVNVTPLDCTSPSAIVSNEVADYEGTPIWYTVFTRYDAIQPLYPANLPRWFNPFNLPSGSGMNYHNDNDSILIACRIMGYAAVEHIAGRSWGSPWDNATMKWSPALKKFEIINGSTDNNYSLWFKCRGKLKTACYTDSSWIFR